MNEFTTAKLTSNAGKESWAQIYQYNQPEETFTSKGEVFVLITKLSRIEPDQIQHFKSLIATFTKSYYSSSQTAFGALKTTVAALLSALTSEDRVEAGVMVNLGNVVYLTCVGRFQAYLLRDDNLFVIFDSEDASGKIVSGSIRVKDKILFANKTLIDNIPQGVIQTALSEIDIQKTAEILTSFVEQSPKDSKVALLTSWQPDELMNIDQNPPYAPIAIGTPKRAGLVRLLDKIIAILPSKRSVITTPNEFKISKRRKMTALIGVGLLALLLLSIVLGSKRKQFLDEQNKYNQQFSTAQSELEEARSIADLSVERARQLLLDAYNIAQGLNETDANKTQLNALKTLINDSLGQIAGLYRSEANLYLDLSLLSSGFEAGQVDLSDNNLLILDKTGTKLVSVDLPSKKAEVVAGPTQLRQAKAIAAYTTKKYVLDSSGIEQVNGSLSLAVPAAWNGEVLIKAFAGNIYVLEKSSSQIWRYSGDAGVFGPKSAWLADSQNLDLGDSTSWMIDGSIWVLGLDGNLLKLINGRLDSFNLTGANGDFSNFYTDSDAKNLYMLDPSAGKVLMFDKKGQFFGEYDLNEAKGATNLIVSESEKTMLIFKGSKVYSVELKHL